jgi:4-amino-4-deoxy-L-arabinose transferase-like glycosyltransferase
MHRRPWVLCLPFMLLLAVTLPHLDQGDFRTDTARYAAVGLQAWRDPAFFWTPHLQPEVPYFNKPPLVFWIHGAFLRAFGVSVVTARLPSILAALAIVAFTMAIARRLFGRSTAVAAGCALALTYECFRRTREISLDLWQLAFMLASVWLYLWAAARDRGGWAFLAGVPLGLALMCKPFMAFLILPVILVLSPRPRLLIPFMVGCLLTALPWHLSMLALHGGAFTDQYLGREVVQRARGLLNAEPWWYYGVEIGRTYWPWGLAFGIGLAASWRSARRRAGFRLAWVALGVWFVVLSAFPDKRPRYALPLYPWMAMISGYGMVMIRPAGWRWLFRRNQARPVCLGVAALGLAAAVLPLKVQAPPDPDLTRLLHWCRDQTDVTFYSAALSTNDEGYFYLMTGVWPRPVTPAERGRLPPEARLIYADGLSPTPSEAEALSFHAGPFKVTRRPPGD